MAADQTDGARCVLGALTAIPTPKAWPAENRAMPVTLDRAAAGIAISYVVIGRIGSRLIMAWVSGAASGCPCWWSLTVSPVPASA